MKPKIERREEGDDKADPMMTCIAVACGKPRTKGDSIIHRPVRVRSTSSDEVDDEGRKGHCCDDRTAQPCIGAGGAIGEGEQPRRGEGAPRGGYRRSRALVDAVVNSFHMIELRADQLENDADRSEAKRHGRKRQQHLDGGRRGPRDVRSTWRTDLAARR